MHPRRPAVLFVALLSTASGAPALPRPDVPDGGVPFLHASAPDLPHLVAAVRRDPAARRRYAQVFHIPSGQVTRFLKRNFVPAMLPRTGLYTVSHVSHRGTIFPVWLTLPAGTPVFVARGGVPMLLRASGDPAVAVNAPTPPVGDEQVIVPAEERIVPLPTTTAH